MSKKKGHNERTGQDMSALGSLGGKANKGTPGARASAAHAAREMWAGKSAEERSAICRERARKAWATRRKNAAKRAKGKA
jgi:hypothetical protein